MKIILCGYNWAGCKALELLLSSNHELFVYTHPSPFYVNSLTDYCKKTKTQYTTQKISLDNLPFIPNMICSIYYRYIIEESVITKVSGKIFNLHPSLLPNYRGCSSLAWAMINGEKKVGFTYHYVRPEVDRGNILLQKELFVEDFDTGVSLYYRLMFEALRELNTVIDLVEAGHMGNPQVGDGSYFSRGAPYDCKIDPSWSAEKIERFIRAMIFPPLPPATIDGESITTEQAFWNRKK